jgi:Lecithin retinol acyltransferase
MHESIVNDRHVTPDESLQPGVRVVTPRRGYLHQGIYVGRGKVIQYGGFARGLHSGAVEEVSVKQFARGRPLWTRNERLPYFHPDEVVRRARSRLGEDRYSLLTNNCEHFCEWCLRAQQRSYQVEEWLARPHRALQISEGWIQVLTALLMSQARSIVTIFGRFAHIRSIGTNPLGAAN